MSEKDTRRFLFPEGKSPLLKLEVGDVVPLIHLVEKHRCNQWEDLTGLAPGGATASSGSSSWNTAMCRHGVGQSARHAVGRIRRHACSRALAGLRERHRDRNASTCDLVTLPEGAIGHQVMHLALLHPKGREELTR